MAVTSISEALRRAILDSGRPLLRIARETGIQRASLSRFVRGKNSLRLDVADKLAAYFGLELTKTTKQDGKQKPKE
jgi:plasmid maintenance system antidote protein VapI